MKGLHWIVENKILRTQNSVKHDFVSGPRARHKISFIWDPHFKHLFSTVQCNPFKPICPSNYFLFDNSGKKKVFLSNFDEFPKEVAHPCIRWLENRPVTERAIFVWEIFFYKWDTLSKYEKLTGKRYHTIKKAVKDVLILP